MSERKEAVRLAELLELQPHPEGGWYRQLYRGTPDERGRPVATSIYFLLGPGEFSALHRIDADEVWNYHSGTPLELVVIEGDELRVELIGDPLHDAVARPQHVVRAGAWFGARPRDPEGYTLVGCTVAPGFDFDGFELGSRRTLAAAYPQHATWIERLTRLE